MRTIVSSKGFHVLLLCILCATVCLLWMVPLLVAGDTPFVSPLLLARNFAASGMFLLTDDIGRFLSTSQLDVGVIASADMRITAFLASSLSAIIPWDNLLAWSFVSAILGALSLLPLWVAVRMMFDRSVAWVGVVLFALFPVTWNQALVLNGYTLAYLFLFLGMALFLLLQKSHRYTALVLAGLCFGIAAGAKDAFLVFVPWIIFCTCWLLQFQWKKSFLHIVTFGVAAFAVYMIPYFGDISAVGYPVNHNIAHFWPGAEVFENGVYLHLYPDPYTYFFDRAWFDTEFARSVADASLLQRLQSYKIMLNFDVGNLGFFIGLLNGAWLLGNNLVHWLHQSVLGGFYTLALVAVGVWSLWRTERKVCIALLGLFLCTEIILRFVLHYARDHTMDMAWIFALFAAVGLVQIAKSLSAQWNIKAGLLVFFLTTATALHLLQINRTELAREFGKSSVATVRSIATELSAAPETAVIAVPFSAERTEQLALLSNRTLALFQPKTIQRLHAQGDLRSAFETYEITHIAGYDVDDENAIFSDIGVGVVQLSLEKTPAPVTLFQRFLLHLFR